MERSVFCSEHMTFLLFGVKISFYEAFEVNTSVFCAFVGLGSIISSYSIKDDDRALVPKIVLKLVS